MSAGKELMRGLAARAFATALRWRSTALEPIPETLVVISPHPDDETLGCGGLIARQVQAGRTVRVLFLTDGEGSHPGHPTLGPGEIARERKSEALAALAALGVRQPAATAAFLGAPDGRLDKLSEVEHRMLHAALVRELRANAPAVVAAPYRGGGSTEHTAAFWLAEAACTVAGVGEILEYPVWAWWNAFRLKPRLGDAAHNRFLPLGAWREMKLRAVACHRTQVLPTAPWREAQLPRSVVTACCAPHEFYFRHRVGTRQRLPATC